jgi:estrogen-related receptor beta like 1
VPHPKEHEDPNAICSGLVAAARRLGFAAPSYPPTRLTSGWGKEACTLLAALASCAIAQRRLVPARPVYRGSDESGGAGAGDVEQGDEEVGWW